MDESAEARIKIYKLLTQEISKLIEKVENVIHSTNEMNDSEKEKKTKTLEELKKSLECIEVNCNGDRDLCKFIQDENDTIIQIMYPNKTHGMKGMEL